MTATDFLGGRFFFLRHGETATNAAGIVAGWTNVPLSDIGEAQARRAAETLKGIGFAAIWTSRLERALRTADIVAERCGRPIRVVDDLAERNWGAWEGTPSVTLDRAAPPPGGESRDEFERRVWRGLSSIEPPHPVLVVAHSGTARTLCARLMPGSAYRRVANASPIEWSCSQDGRWTMRDLMCPSVLHPTVAEPS